MKRRGQLRLTRDPGDDERAHAPRTLRGHARDDRERGTDRQHDDPGTRAQHSPARRPPHASPRIFRKPHSLVTSASSKRKMIGMSHRSFLSTTVFPASVNTMSFASSVTLSGV